MKRTPLKRKTPLRSKGRKAERDADSIARFRIAVAMRSGGWCEANTPSCAPGRHEGTQAHHRLMRSQGGTHDPENGLWCCSQAHAHIHRHPAESYERGWLLRRWEVA